MLTTIQLLELAAQSAGQDENDDLAFEIHSLLDKHQAVGDPDDEIEQPTVTPQTYSSGLTLTMGQYRGRKLSELDSTELHRAWSGYKAYHPLIAEEIKAELDRRIQNQ